MMTSDVIIIGAGIIGNACAYYLAKRGYHVIVLEKSVRTALEAEKDIVLICRFQRIVKTADDIVSARSLSAGKDHADDLLLSS